MPDNLNLPAIKEALESTQFKTPWIGWTHNVTAEAALILNAAPAMVAEIERLETENMALAAHQCKHPSGDERGNPVCEEVESLRRQVDRLKADNIATDGTDAAHPSYWRGNDAAFAAMCEQLRKILDGEDDCSGKCQEPWDTLRRRVLVLHQQLATAKALNEAAEKMLADMPMLPEGTPVPMTEFQHDCLWNLANGNPLPENAGSLWKSIEQRIATAKAEGAAEELERMAMKVGKRYALSAGEIAERAAEIRKGLK